MSKVASARGVAIAVCALAACQSAMAQEPAPEPASAPAKEQPLQAPKSDAGVAPMRRVVRSDQTPASSGPWRAGGFLLYPEISATYMQDSNVFATKSDRISDWAMIYTPALWVNSDWGRHALNFQAAADVTDYNSQKDENTNDWRVSGEGRYDFTNDLNAYGGLRYAREHLDREDKDARNGAEPTVYYNARAYAGVFRQLDAWSVRIAGSAQNLNYDDVPGSEGNIINNDDQDRDRYTLGIRAGYGFSARMEGFAQAALDNRRYQNLDDVAEVFPVQAGGLKRDSDGYRLLLGARYSLPGKLKAEGFVGYLNQDYEDSRLADVSKPAFGGNLIWQAAENTKLSLFLDRTVEETNTNTSTVSVVLVPEGAVIQPVLTGIASSYLNTYVGATLDQRLNPSLGLYGNASFSRSDYQGVERVDDYTGVGLGLWYRAAKYLYLDGSYNYRYLLSTDNTQNFDRNQFFLRFTIPLIP